MAATVTAPIRESQINNTLYAGEAGFPNIQAAIDYSAAQGGNYTVVIPSNYAGSDTIASLLRGQGTILCDQRNENYQVYVWNGTNYTPNEFTQLGGFIAQGEAAILPSSMVMGFDPTGFSGAGSGHIVVVSNSGKGTPEFSLALSSDASPGTVILRGADDVDGGIGIQIEGNCLLSHDPTGPLQAATKEYVDNKVSVVQTYPASGIAVSTGTAWSTSLDPNNSFLPLTGGILSGNLEVNGILSFADTAANEAPQIFSSNNAGALNLYGYSGVNLQTRNGNYMVVDLSNGVTFNTTVKLQADPTQPLQAATKQYVDAHAGGGGGGATYPPAGIPVSTGTAWGTSLDPNNSYLPLTGGTVTGTNRVYFGDAYEWIANPGGNQLQIAFDNGISLTPWNGSPLFAITWSNSLQAFSCSFSIPVNLPADPTAPLQAATKQYVDAKQTQIIQAPDEATAISESTANPNNIYYWGGGTNNAFLPLAGGTLSGTLFCNAGITVQGAPAQAANSLNLGLSGSTSYIDFVGPNTTTVGNGYIRCLSSNGSVDINALHIDTSGNATFSGTVTAASKAFKIPHPLDETKHLIHACLEGPENGVFYRGEGETVKGLATVALPDYFEALTLPEDRTVTLTQISENGREEFSMLMASRVNKGLFYVRSSEPSVKFFWEVKAVRKDVAPLEVEPLKEMK